MSNADAALIQTLTNSGNVTDPARVFADRYGAGWQKKLAGVLGLPETTVNGWFRSGKVPQLAKIAFGALLSDALRARTPARYIAIRNGDSYSVCSWEEPAGRIIAENINDINTARLLAAAPLLREALGECAWLAEAHAEDNEDFDPAVQLSDAAFAAADPLTVEVEPEAEDQL